MRRRKTVFIFAVLFLGLCIYSCFYQMGSVKGPVVELADFSDIPYEEGLGHLSVDCAFDLNFDGKDDVFWFDQNYPRDRTGAQPLIVGFKIEDEILRLESFDVKELHSFVLSDLNAIDQRYDLIISMTQGADNSPKTAVISIPYRKIFFGSSRTLKADYWHLGGADSKNQQDCLIDGLYQGVSEEGYLLIGNLRLKPGRNYTLTELDSEMAV